jgi:3-methyl-2-oxobutanoate hydroxymethyltransferase
MSVHKEIKKKVTTLQLKKMKKSGEKISALTAYDFTMAKIIDEAGIDMIIVGDSASNTMIGNQTTLSISLQQMMNFARAVVNGVNRALVVADMPFGTVSGNPFNSLDAAIVMMRETGVDAIKIEGGAEIVDDVKKIIDAGIPVIVHLGLMPQSINKYGSYEVRGKEEEEANKLIMDCKLMEKIGAFALVLEKIPSELTAKISKEVSIPIIGIGAGIEADGQVLVIQDVMGMNKDFSPKFLRRYADLYAVMTNATKNYINDVKLLKFPNESESY